MLSFIIIGAAIIGSLGLAVEYFVLNDLIKTGVVISKQDFYLKLLLTYVVLLIPPYIMMSPKALLPKSNELNQNLAIRSGTLIH